MRSTRDSFQFITEGLKREINYCHEGRGLKLYKHQRESSCAVPGHYHALSVSRVKTSCDLRLAKYTRLLIANVMIRWPCFDCVSNAPAYHLEGLDYSGDG